MQLGKDVFVALAAIAWADGEVAPEETEALLGAASASGLSGADLEAVEAATKTPVPLERLTSLSFDGDERLFVYSVALWLIEADGVITPEETAAMDALARAMNLSDEDRDLVTAAALGTMGIDDEGEAGGRDLVTLAREIARSAREA